MKQITRIFFMIFCMYFILNVPSTARAEAEIGNLIITKVNVDNFPQVNIQFRALDTFGFPATQIQQELFNIYENEKEILSIENLNDAEEGIWIHFVIDAGVWLYGTRWENAQSVIQDFIQTTPWMKDNVDHVSLTVVEASGARTLVDFTTKGNEVLASIRNYNPPRQEYSASIQAMDEILDEMATIPEAVNQAKFLFFLSSGLESGTGASLDQLIQKSNILQIPIYTVLLRNSSSEEYGEPLERLADESFGLYAQYANLASIAPLFSRLIEYRHQYVISYRSNIDLSGNYPVELIANVGIGSVSDTNNYDITVNPPRVSIIFPSSSDVITRKSEEYTNDRTTIPPTSVTVITEVLFPDNPTRRLRTATLFVDDDDIKTISNPNTNLELVWNISSILDDGSYALKVVVEDELGIEASSPVVIVNVQVEVPSNSNAESVDIDALKDQLTEDIRDEIEGAISVPAIICFIKSDWICSNLERPFRRNLIPIISVLISSILVVVVFLNRNHPVLEPVTGRVTGIIDTITNKIRRSEPVAFLEILEGGSVGKHLEVYGDTSIGRSHQYSEIVFNTHGDHISRLHCNIINKESKFTIRDEGSANGTFVNGKRLEHRVDETLRDGDELELGIVERGGIRLKFHLVKEGDSTTLDAKTRRI